MFSFKSLCLKIVGAAFGMCMPSAAVAQEFTFSVHHFLSPKAVTQTRLIEPWVAAIEEASGGRIAFEVFPSMSLGGKPSELYGQVRDGVADVVWTLPGYTPGVFPRLEVFELPNVHGGDALATNRAIQDLMTDLAADLDDIHPLLVHVHAGNALHLASGNVAELKDFGGLKVRSPSRTGAWMLEALGAEPVGMPVPALPQALAKKTVDAGLVPFEVAIPLKLADLTIASVELNGGARFGTSTFLFAMNKVSYASLPSDLQAIVDEVSGRVLSEAMGAAWNEMEPLGKERARAAGATVSALSAENTAAFDVPFQKVADRWVSEVSSIGIDGAELLERARAAVATHSK